MSIMPHLLPHLNEELMVWLIGSCNTNWQSDTYSPTCFFLHMLLLRWYMIFMHDSMRYDQMCVVSSITNVYYYSLAYRYSETLDITCKNEGHWECLRRYTFFSLLGWYSDTHSWCAHAYRPKWIVYTYLRHI